jgi:hypothetical protein
VTGEGDLVCHDNHRDAVFAELPHDREHFSDQFGIERRGDLVNLSNASLTKDLFDALFIVGAGNPDLRSLTMPHSIASI